MINNQINNSFFTPQLLLWYEANKRNLPWRFTNNPYFIWISEIILQQTRVDQGLPYYNRFIDAYPNIEMLASATEDEIFSLWQGLGYYNRARNMHATARRIVNEYGGVFPTKYDDVLSLKGIGEYTAAAIMSFAYNKPYAAVDGNVYRVLSRVFGIDDFIDTSQGKKVFQNLADELLDQKSPGLFNQALMEFGALQCVPQSPNCNVCPFIGLCVAYQNKLIKELPQKRGKVKVRNRYFNYFDIRVGDNLFLKKREGKDIWRGLYEFPLLETATHTPYAALCRTESFKVLFSDGDMVNVTHKQSFKHILSHQIIYATVYRMELPKFENDRYIQLNKTEISTLGISKLLDNYLKSIEE